MAQDTCGRAEMADSTATAAPTTDAALPAARAARRRNTALFLNFFRRELVTRYLGSTTGLLWALLHPLALLGVYHFVFTTVFRTRGFGDQSFLLFVAVALWPWLAAQEGLQRATVSLANYAGLIRKVAFPHELAVYASIAATFALHFVGYVVVLIVLALFGEPVQFAGLVLAVPVWIVLALATGGMALALSSLQVFIRDIEHVLMPVLMILMYLTPILYPLALVPEQLRPWVAANPFGWIVDRLRAALLEGRLGLEWSDLVAIAITVTLFVTGRWMFRRLSPHFEDFI